LERRFCSLEKFLVSKKKKKVFIIPSQGRRRKADWPIEATESQGVVGNWEFTDGGVVIRGPRAAHRRRGGRGRDYLGRNLFAVSAYVWMPEKTLYQLSRKTYPRTRQKKVFVESTIASKNKLLI